MTLLAFLAVLSELTLATVLGIWFIDVSSLGAVYTVEYALINHIFITVLAVIAEDFCESSLSLRFGVLQDNVVNAFLSGCANLAQKDGSQAK